MTLKERIQMLIAEDHVQQAIDELIAELKTHTADEEPLCEILIISSNFRNLAREYSRGTIRYGKYRRHANDLLRHILCLIDEITNDVP